MQLLAAVVLAGVVTMTPVPGTSPATAVGTVTGFPQRVEVQAAGALWRIGLAVRATGEFRTADGSEVSSVISDEQGFGSGFMVSPDGYLMTAFHVVGPSELARDACTIHLKKYDAPILRSLQVDYALQDIVENRVAGRITVLPVPVDGNICADPTAITWAHDESLPFRIVKMEPSMDLALLKLNVKDVAFIPTSNPALKEGDTLYALGFVESNRFTKETGKFVRECELATDIEQADGSTDTTKYQFAHILVGVEAGMSGGPVMAGGALAGVTVAQTGTESEVENKDGTTETVTSDEGYAVPAVYVHAWYLWATGKSAVKPGNVCEHPYVAPVEENSTTSKPRR